MSRIPTPASIEAAPAKTHATLETVEKQLGLVPNMFRLIANNPAALEGYVALNGALAKGTLSAASREQIAIAIAEVNGCSYCLSAHTYLGKNVARLDDAELASNRSGHSADPKVAAALAFAIKVATARGAVGEADLDAVRGAGFSDAELLEIVAHVALNTLTNYVNEVFATDIDFPLVAASRAA